MPAAPPIRMVLADVDGTLVTGDKVLTDASVAAVRELHRHGIDFAVTSGRPPRGMAMLIEPLRLTTPIAGFNGGVVVEPDMSVIEARTLPAGLVRPVADLMAGFSLDVWVYRGADWFVADPGGPHVAKEARTVAFEPTVMDGLDGLTDGVAKLVGVSDDHEAVTRASAAVHDRFGDHLAASPSQPYYLDVTHPEANKGAVVSSLAARYGLDEAQIATIGDMPNDMLMFARSGLSIAMGNAEPQVQRAARRVTATNEDDGFAEAIRRYVLGAGAG